MRIKGLDFLRGIAILLVVLRHGSTNELLFNIGWVGVDLFFVLSGFLIGGLIFREYIHTGDVNVKRFLIRRGFKIYPPFYFFIFITIVLNYWQTKTYYPTNLILNEVFYLQSYFPSIWYHTWSLAIEEQFYIGFALFIFICLKAKLFRNPKIVGYLLFALLLLVTFLRFDLSYENRDKDFFAFLATHLRMDGIVIGVLIAYLYYFTNFNNFFSKYKYLFLLLAAILISPIFLYKGGSYFMNTFGISSFNLGFGILVLFSVSSFKDNFLRRSLLFKIPLLIISFIGIHSFSIYLWHLMAEKITHYWLGFNPKYYSVVFIFVSLSFGIFLSIIIEKPFLLLRDRFYKSESKFKTDSEIQPK